MILNDSGEDQVYAYARILKLDNRDECVGDHGQICDGALGGHGNQELREVHEVVFAGDVFRGDDEGIDIGARAKNPEPETAIREDLSPCISNEDLIVGKTFLCDTTNELVADSLK